MAARQWGSPIGLPDASRKRAGSPSLATIVTNAPSSPELALAWQSYPT